MDNKIDNIKNEIQIISKFYHPNIVTYHTTIQENDNLYIVMEYCENDSLAEKINKSFNKLADN